MTTVAFSDILGLGLGLGFGGCGLGLGLGACGLVNITAPSSVLQKCRFFF